MFYPLMSCGDDRLLHRRFQQLQIQHWANFSYGGLFSVDDTCKFCHSRERDWANGEPHASKNAKRLRGNVNSQMSGAPKKGFV